ncbi:hypothetical protein CC1G_03823 [Coprinopsis cinerea okayama7|uniref:Uncharacterized protein n=1 Tax=Coprinopsis cinerea (strain Okayama-7 / 130 / ATCC MYA-4618 / FGSC 9003) TaxID=240176 RepID=A8NGV0_COPC7|nr:hypothetical protein CC1G_03823 [Coprinopsis cinerea okayama7\|eukprot:XP_001833606.1 hypothetical protein CC1G_03823 [Coprinopsis cinerea okayama7\
MTTQPEDDILLSEIQCIQEADGKDIGIKRLQEILKTDHPDWILGAKRLRSIRKDNGPAIPVPETEPEPGPKPVKQPPAITKADIVSFYKPRVVDPFIIDGEPLLKLHITLVVGPSNFRELPGDRIFQFIEDIPTKWCRKGAPREESSAFLTQVLKSCEEWVLSHSLWLCRHCGKAATMLWGVPMATLPERPPFVIQQTSPVCKVNSQCMRETYALNQKAVHGLMQKNLGEVYKITARSEGAR